MSDDADAAKDQEARDADREVDSMQDQLSKEVASWSKSRSLSKGQRRQASEPVTVPSSPLVQPRSVRSARRPMGTSAPAVAAKGDGTGLKPFSMSYGGMTQAEYVKQLLERGTR